MLELLTFSITVLIGIDFGRVCNEQKRNGRTGSSDFDAVIIGGYNILLPYDRKIRKKERCVQMSKQNNAAVQNYAIEIIRAIHRHPEPERAHTIVVDIMQRLSNGEDTAVIEAMYAKDIAAMRGAKV